MDMATKYKQLSLEERERIAIMKAEGKSIRQIGRLLGRDHGTIQRELRRNSAPVYKVCYLPSRANSRAEERKRRSGERSRLKTKQIRTYVETRLRKGWSPEQISGRLPKDFPNRAISHEAIYQYIYVDRVDLIGYLTRRHRKRYAKGHSRKHQSSHIPNRISISERSGVVDRREEFGHWEADSLISRASKSALNVLVERTSRLTKITKMNRKCARLTRISINRRLAQYPQRARMSITYDNGSENTEHERVNEALNTRSFFCNPFHSWEKGTVENTIGLVRRFIPKKTDIRPIPDAAIRRIEYLLNTRPRKCLAFQTPIEAFGQQLCGALPR